MLSQQSVAEQVLRQVFVSNMVVANFIFELNGKYVKSTVLGFPILPGSFRLVSRCEGFILVPETDKVSLLHAESEM